MTQHSRQLILAVSDREYACHRRWRLIRFLAPNLYPRDLHSGRPVKEFVRLADHCARLGIRTVPTSRLPDVAADSAARFVKFGASAPAEDVAFLRKHPSGSEWNISNIVRPADLSDYLQLGRKVWSFHLGVTEHRAEVERLFSREGTLFVKSRVKGFAELCHSCSEFWQMLGNLDELCEESAEILVSGPLTFRTVTIQGDAGAEERSDEWRHYVYKQSRIASRHAFFCDDARSDQSGEDINIEAAERAIHRLARTNFATSYVLDTGTLADGSVCVVEANNLFASGLYSCDVVRAIASALGARQDNWEENTSVTQCTRPGTA